MADKIPDATLAVIDGAGHAPPVSHPDAFNAVLRSFLAGLQGAMTTHDAVRAEVRALARRALGPRRRPARLAPPAASASGWATPTWPTEWYGRGLPGWADAIVAEEFGRRRRRRRGARGRDDASPRRRCSPTAPTSSSAPAAAGDHRRGHVVPAVQRARQRLRPRRADDAGRARRRRVGRQRPEAVEHERPPRRPRHAPGPHRLGRAQAPRHQLLRAADAPARRRGPPAAPDERPRLVQRGVPHRRPGAGGEPRRRSPATAGASP